MLKWFVGKRGAGARFVALALPVCLTALFASPALATTTIGQTGTPSVFSASAGQEGINVPAVVTAAGTVTSFQTQSLSGAVPGVYDFQVLRPEGNNQYLVVGHTGNHTDPADGSLVTIPVNIPVQAGDVLGAYVVKLWAGILSPWTGGSITSNFQAQPSPGQTISMQSATTTPANQAAIDESATVGPAQVSGPPSTQLSNLSKSLAGINGGSFSSQLQSVQASLAAGQTSTACNQLNAFANHVRAQSGKHITVAQADQALTDTARISALIGC